MEPTNLNGPLFESFFWIQAAPLHAKAAALASAAPPKPARDKGGKDGTAAVKVKSPTNLVPQVLWHYPEDVSRIAAEFRDIPQFCFPGIAASPPTVQGNSTSRVPPVQIWTACDWRAARRASWSTSPSR